jgi:Ca2+-binding RTX toxin-like protein
VDAGDGDDFIIGGMSSDTYTTTGNGALVDAPPNEVFGGAGNDYVAGDKGNDRVDGGSGNDEGQGGWRDGRADWIDSVEVLYPGCALSDQ